MSNIVVNTSCIEFPSGTTISFVHTKNLQPLNGFDANWVGTTPLNFSWTEINNGPNSYKYSVDVSCNIDENPSNYSFEWSIRGDHTTVQQGPDALMSFNAGPGAESIAPCRSGCNSR